MERTCVLFLFGGLLLQLSMVGLAVVPSNVTDQLALLAFKKEISFDPNNILARNWSTGTNFCNWIGVSCSIRRQRVTAIELLDLGLGGTISPYIGNLSFLVGLDLRNNSFHGYLAHEVGHLRRLRGLILQDNQLEGTIPPNLSLCMALRVASLAYNKFSGGIPNQLPTLPRLRTLYLGGNNLDGVIPSSLGNISTLMYLGLGQNKFKGSIPVDLGSLSNLVELYLSDNDLTGMVPPAMFNLSGLQLLDLSWNELSGNLPSTTGFWLPNLELLKLQVNKFDGKIPVHLSNSSKLALLSFDHNFFTGQVPIELGTLQKLEKLRLEDNQLTIKPGGSELSFLSALTNCRSLEWLTIDYNPFNGIIPSSFENHSSPLQIFTVSGCLIRGHIPEGIGSFKNLCRLSLVGNHLSGTIPLTIGGLHSLQGLFLQSNMLEGVIPNEICLLKNLGGLFLGSNKLSGFLPACIGNLSHLQALELSSNRLTSSVPSSLWTLENLILLNLSNNYLSSYIPMSAKLDVIENLDLSSNQISGNIPNIIGDFQRLSSLNLSKNLLQGPIPQSFGGLISLEYMDLSFNNLSGAIPKSLEALKYLKLLNLSFNMLSGEIPSKGPFANLTAESFLRNMALCGNPVLKVPPCSHVISGSNSERNFLKYGLPAIASLVILVALFYFLRKCRTINVQVPAPIAILPKVEQRMISYHELLRATENFSEANLLGVGSVASVYKGVLSDGIEVAIKVLNLQQESAFKSFDAECKVLRTVRHRNLVKVISSCSNPEFRALILQYMSNGSLGKWLYSHNHFLNLFQRVSIMADVAQALEYLHHDQSEPVVHCDLKPNNVLLNDDMVAHVGDFGIAKILAENQTTTQTKTLGTLGYIAPEYGFEGIVSTKCDTYSYGIMLLEVLTRKKPTDDMFSADLSLRQWVLEAFPDNIMDVIDGNLLRAEDWVATNTKNNLLAIFEIGLDCSREFPEERSDIKVVAVQMKKIKYQLLGNRRA